jgi:indole-3-glycerol phosphate synthase
MSFLQEILQFKKQEVEARRKSVPVEKLSEMLAEAAPPLSLKNALRSAEEIGIVAEIKKASPSAGIIREDFVPLKIASGYMNAGADAISVLTDENFFSGSLSYIQQIRPLVNAPILRKDFIIDPYQLLEARAYDADAVLLIVAALSDRDLKVLLGKTAVLGMDALVEVHNKAELQRALGGGAEIIGINHRNLETFVVDISITETLAPLIPSHITLVAESGLTGAAEIVSMKRAGAHGVLIGSYLMRRPYPGKALSDLKEEIRRCFA